MSLESVQELLQSPEQSSKMPPELVQERLRAFYEMTKKSVLGRKIAQRSRMIKDNKL